MTPTPQTISQAQRDVEVFAREIVGRPLWPHQVDLVTDGARVCTVRAGRQAGKSEALSILALHVAFARPASSVLLVSAGEVAARDLLGNIAELAQGPLLRPSVIDDNASSLTLSNRSTIRSVPASEKQIRGRSVDLLVVDEAAFVAEDVWRAARWTTVARKGSRIVLSSTPWGDASRFFAVAEAAGERGERGFSAHHWPSTASPLVDQALIDAWRSTMTDREYRMEVLGEWVDVAGAWFRPDELERATTLAGERGFELVDPAKWNGPRIEVAAGVDWGFKPDANAVVLIGEVPSWLEWGRPGVLWVPYAAEHYGLAYEAFIERIVELGSRRSAFRFGGVTSEANGVGAMPSQVLRRRLADGFVCSNAQSLFTDNRRKEAAFSHLKMLLESDRLALPNFPPLLRQLSALEFSTSESGQLRLSVPERRGHDDLAMALMLAVSPAVEEAQAWRGGRLSVGHYSLGDEARGVEPVTVWEDADDETAERLARAERYAAGALSDGGPPAERERVRAVARRIVFGPEAVDEGWSRR